MSWKDEAVKAANRKLERARALIAKCETDLGRTLSGGERRDLLKDNTTWDSEFVAAVVAELNPYA